MMEGASIKTRVTTATVGSWGFWRIFIFVAFPYHGIAAGSNSSIFNQLHFELEPDDIVAVRNSAAILDCVALGLRPFDIYWIKDGVAIQYDIRRYKLQNNSLYFTFVEHSSTHRPDEGLYQCAAYIHSEGTIVSRRAKLQVAYLNGFIREPEDSVVGLGDTVLVPCELDAYPLPKVQWYKDSRVLDRSSLGHFVHANNMLEIRNLIWSDLGKYQCRAWNQAGEKFSHIATLAPAQGKAVASSKGNHLDFAISPADVSTMEGSSAVILCAVNGRDQNGEIIRLKWLKDGLPLEVMEKSNGRNRFSIEGQGSLRIVNVVETDGGTYTCRASSTNASVSSNATLVVLVPPRFVKRPGNIITPVNSDVELECDIYANPPAAIEWLKNGEVVIASDYFQVIDERNLRILGLVESDEGMYQCTAANKAGMIQSSAQLLIVPTGATLTDSGVPSAPVDLSIVTVTSSMATVSWQPSPSSKGSNGASGYVISWKAEGSGRERTLNTSSHEAKIEQLKSSTKYAVEVKAYNLNGFSQGSEVLQFETLEKAGLVSESLLGLRVTVSSSTSVRLSWDAVVSQDQPITHYKIYYGWLRDAQSGESDVNVIENQYTVTGLLKFYEYRFRVVAYHRFGPGKSSDEVRCRTFSDVPSSAPQNVSVEAVSSNVIVLGWDPPPEGTQNGEIIEYRIEHKQRKDKTSKALTVDGSKRSLEIADLEKGTEYSFRIMASTVNGSGPASTWLTKATLRHDLDETRVPGKPSSLRVRPLADAVMVSWTPPSEQDILIRGYILGYGIGIPDIYRQILDARRRHHTVKGLRASSEYVISLKAFNTAGEGIPIYETTFTREMTTPEPLLPLMPPIGVKTVVLSSTSISLSWSDTSLGRGQRIGDNRYYTVRYNQKFQHRYRFVNCTELSLLVDDLRPDTEYEFSVKVSKGNRQSTWSLSAFNVTNEAAPSASPRDLTLVPVGESTAVALNWQPPRQANGQITGYLLYYSTDSTLPDGEWVVEGVLGDRLSTVIRELTPETTYYFKIQARNSIGAGPMSPTVIFRTPTVDGMGGAIIETPDDFGKSAHNSMNQKTMEKPDTVPSGDNGQVQPLYLWIIVGCVGSSLILIFVVALVTALCCYCTRPRHSKRHKHSATAPKSKCVHKGLKPPDLWIHGNVELSETDLAEHNISEMESATIGRRKKRSASDKSGRDEERYRSSSLRPVPLMIPVDTPQSSREPGFSIDESLPLCQGRPPAVVGSTFPSRSQCAVTPRVNVADITQSNSSGELLASVSTSFRVPSTNHITSTPQVCLPLLALDDVMHMENHGRSSNLPNCISTEELTEEMANIEGLMRDLNDITHHHFSY